MDRLKHLRMIVGTVEEYRDSFISLGTLIDEVQAILSVLNDQRLKDSLLDQLGALEEVYALSRMDASESGIDFDFETDGKPIVKRSVRDLLDKLGVVLSSESTQN